MKLSITWERKFVPTFLPDDINLWRIEKVNQWYLTPPNKYFSIRIREYEDDRIYLDVVFGRFLKRIKLGIKLKLKPNWINKYHIIEKTRYKKYENGILMIYDDFNNGFKLYEIESKNKNKILNYKTEFIEVTFNIKYTNNWIAFNPTFYKH